MKREFSYELLDQSVWQEEEDDDFKCSNDNFNID